MNLVEKIKFDKNGLVPAIIQDEKTGNVLMLAYMNRDSLQLSLETGYTHFWSRSRSSLWKKGETSGHYQKIVSVLYDCDYDTLLFLVDQTGAACHTGNKSCFYRSYGDGKKATYNAINRLAETIKEHCKLSKDVSYTAKLFDKGIDTILKKVGEEATELVVAAKGGKSSEIIYEAADLIYHMMVLLHYSRLSFYDIESELIRRFGVSGIEEKRSREIDTDK